MKVAVVGATGMVGNIMLKVLEERKFQASEFICVASERSIGRKLNIFGSEVQVVSMQDAIDSSAQVALFSAGGDISLKWAPKFAETGTVVIDNSSAWRMDPTKKLIVPEINAHLLSSEDKIIANPNCSTIQMVMALAPLHKSYGIKRVVVSTYQSVTGTGQKAMRQLEEERKDVAGERVYPHPIDKNCIPHCDVFLDNDYTKEEMKLVNETRKILGSDKIAITATAVRIPVVGGHSESVNVEFERDFDINDVKELLSKTAGITLYDDPKRNIYPMPIQASGKDDVFVGRIRRDESNKNSLNLWIVADNLRKGAATNAVQIAEYLIANKILESKVNA
ncbi:MAG: aspartate-semialdehyde dehydrogenase [Bacteroidia bacterium]|nr:aspartate-semialdehyde dehydrogenase [Bacteroidia bacterium]